MTVGEPANGGGNGRLLLDRRISIGSIIQLVVMVLGGLWILAQLQADVAAEREQLGALRGELASQMAQLRTDLSGTVARLDGRMDMLRDQGRSAR
jgi:hypothetical protein